MGLIDCTWQVLRPASRLLHLHTPLPRGALLRTYFRLLLGQVLAERTARRSTYIDQLLGMRLRFYDYNSLIFLFDEIFLNDQYYFKARSTEPTIIDCGANIGLSVLFFKSLYPQSKIVAFEPDNSTFSILENNVKSNCLQDVHLRNQALTGYPGKVEVYHDLARPYPGSVALTTVKTDRSAIRGVAESVLLSDHICHEVDFLKMDIEGAEFDVIKELSSSRKLGLVREMAIEYHHHLIPEQDKLSTMLSILEDAGFGYQLHTWTANPLVDKGQLQDVLIRAYRKSN
jgi:FkbM family methyltransferase